MRFCLDFHGELRPKGIWHIVRGWDARIGFTVSHCDRKMLGRDRTWSRYDVLVSSKQPATDRCRLCQDCARRENWPPLRTTRPGNQRQAGPGGLRRCRPG